MSGAAAAKVLYRGPPGMKKGMYYFIGSVFTIAGCSQGYLLSQHMSLPLFSRNAAETELASPYIRYTTGFAIAASTSALGFFFFWTPTRLGTRVTFYPATSTVGVRTAAAPFRAHLPSAMRIKNSVAMNPKDKNERLYPWESLYRRDGTSAVEIQKYVQGNSAVSGSSNKAARVPSSLLIGEKVSVGFQLEAAPIVMHQAQTKNLYKLWWANFKLSLRGDTDWSTVAGENGLTKQEAEAKHTKHPKDPYFLDRANFDRLFPTRGPRS